MKNLLFTLFMAFFCTISMYGQNVPQAFNYQGIVTDTDDAPVTTQIGLQVKLRQGSATGTVVYTEAHTPIPNLNGIFNVKIGEGSTTDDFAGIDWLSDQYFVEIGIDITGGTTYDAMDAVQLVSIPYALAAEEAEKLRGFPVSGTPVEGDILIWDGSNNKWSPQALPPVLVNSIAGNNGINVSADTDGNYTVESDLGTSISNSEIETGAVTTDEILDGTIQASDIGSSVITTDKILNGTIQNADIGGNAVNGNNIANYSISSVDLAYGSVNSSTIQNNSILGEDIAAGTISEDKLSFTTSSDIVVSAGLGFPNPSFTSYQITTNLGKRPKKVRITLSYGNSFLIVDWFDHDQNGSGVCMRMMADHNGDIDLRSSSSNSSRIGFIQTGANDAREYEISTSTNSITISRYNDSGSPDLSSGIMELTWAAE